MKALTLAAAFLLVLPVMGSASVGLREYAPSHPRPRAAFSAKPFDGRIDVMTYNVHGLPWPIASDRPAKLKAIGDSLHTLHMLGSAPDIVLLQEAFTSEAKAIGARAGYRYVAFGPGAADAQSGPIDDNGQWQKLKTGARWLKGEALGKFVGSGLAILSDYPISKVTRMAFSTSACAGYDCLAAKGALIARLNLPGSRQIEVATTHMNSRGASAVPGPRADLAWTEQAHQLSAFIARSRNPSLPLILGGDLNVGKVPDRQSGIASFLRQLGRDAHDALRSLDGGGARLSADARYELGHAKDWEISTGGQQGGELIPLRASVPFGGNHGAPLSDHYGYDIQFSMTQAGKSAQLPNDPLKTLESIGAL